MSNYSYLLIGGDKRQECLFNMLKRKKLNVEKIFLNENENISNASEKIYGADVIILPIPATKDGQTLFSPQYNGKISLEFLAEKFTDKSTVFLGGENEVIYKSKAKKIVNLLSNETLTLKNAMATAEAAISIIIENVNHTIFGAEILIIGYGRIAKILTDYLLALKGNITVCARKEIARAKATLKGAKTLDFNSVYGKLPNFNIIINTVPSQILKKEELKLINKNAFIIDLASLPGGIDFDSAKELGLKTIQALALPGKYSPESSAEFIEQAINYEMM